MTVFIIFGTAPFSNYITSLKRKLNTIFFLKEVTKLEKVLRDLKLSLNELFYLSTIKYKVKEKGPGSLT